jgi:hypothetical protein
VRAKVWAPWERDVNPRAGWTRVGIRCMARHEVDLGFCIGLLFPQSSLPLFVQHAHCTWTTSGRCLGGTDWPLVVS